MSLYKVIDIDLLHDGILYPEGSEVELEKAQAKQNSQHLQLLKDKEGGKASSEKGGKQ